MKIFNNYYHSDYHSYDQSHSQSLRWKSSLLTFTMVFLVAFFIISPMSTLSAKSKDNSLTLKQILLMPGDVTTAHAEIENQCDSCHVQFDKKNQSPLCTQCHELISDEITATKGFHGKLSPVQLNDCGGCHTDHKGRDFDITGLDKELYDHNNTDFPLEGKHHSLACDSCHKETSDKDNKAKGFRFKEVSCNGCHEDFHDEALGNECDTCHSEEDWHTSTFDHAKTDFPLEGKHKDAICSSCHANNSFSEIDTQCKSCHLTVDSHLGIMGNQCEDCHNSKTKWDENDFSHQTDTKYKLEGKHTEVACIGCHSKELKPANECFDCHNGDDVHQGTNGLECESCHSNNDWDSTDFTHETALTGSHKDVDCIQCHTPGEDEIKTELNECIFCHKSKDVHRGELGKQCESCHMTDDWKGSTKFNHDFVDFPLTGSHRLLVCESCHTSDTFSTQKGECINCHTEDDAHDKTLGKQCDSCHDTSVWSHWQFDHDEATSFALTGSHVNLQCDLCHIKNDESSKVIGTECISCHRQDDVHNGGFSTDCQQCHNTKSFEESSF